MTSTIEKPSEDLETLRQDVENAIRLVYDPEIPVNIYELGLIYDIHLEDAPEAIRVEMTLTSPACPAAQSLPLEVEQKVKDNVAGVEKVTVDVVWDPPWDMEKMSDSAKLELGFM